MVSAVSIAAFVFYALTACRTVYFGDAGELVTAAAELGVAHPPGYPLWTLLAKAALVVPMGEPAFRVALLSAACAAAACGMAARWVLGGTGSIAAALAAAGLLAVSNVIWAAATVPEVYTLHLVLVLAFLEAARAIGINVDDERRVRRAIFATAAILGAGLAHHPTIVLAIPSAAVLAWPGRNRLTLGVSAIAVLIVVTIPAAAYLSLLPRAAAHPEASWGTLTTFGDLAAHAMAAQYRAYDLGWAGLLRSEAWRSLGAVLIGGTGGLGVLAAAWGVVRTRQVKAAVTSRERSRSIAALAVLAVCSCLFALRYGVEEVDAYLIPAVAAISILAGYGIQATSNRGRLLAGGAAALIVAIPLVRNFSERDLHAITAAADYGRDIFDTLPREAILIADGDDTFVLAYLQRVLHERPDVAIYDRDGFVLRDVLDEPSIAPPRGASAARVRMQALAKRVSEAIAGSRPRDVFFMSLPEIPLPPSIRIDVHGLLFRASPATSRPDDDERVWTRYRESRVVEQVLRVDGPFAGAVAGQYPLMRAEAALVRGDRTRAVAETEAAIARAGRSETVHNAAGTIYGRLESYDLAIREFEAALAIKPSSARARANLEEAHRLRGR